MVFSVVRKKGEKSTAISIELVDDDDDETSSCYIGRDKVTEQQRRSTAEEVNGGLILCEFE